MTQHYMVSTPRDGQPAIRVYQDGSAQVWGCAATHGTLGALLHLHEYSQPTEWEYRGWWVTESSGRWVVSDGKARPFFASSLASARRCIDRAEDAEQAPKPPTISMRDLRRVSTALFAAAVSRQGYANEYTAWSACQDAKLLIKQWEKEL